MPITKTKNGLEIKTHIELWAIVRDDIKENKTLIMPKEFYKKWVSVESLKYWFVLNGCLHTKEAILKELKECEEK